MERSNGLKEAETIDAHKTLTCEGVDYNYRFDGAHFEIKPPVEIGEGSCRSLLSHGYIQMTDFNLCFNRDIEAKGNFSTPRTELAFCMGHGIEWGTSLKSDYFVIDTGEIALFHGGVRSENCTYLSGAGYRFISIDMSPAQFERMTSGLTEDTRLRIGAGAGLFFGKNNITPSIRFILSQIADCSYSHGMRELYLEGKMLELMAVYLNESLYEADRIPRSVKLSREDMESLRLAKEMFGYTVHAYVIEQRMQRAKQLLEQGSMTVSEAAYRVGYGNVSHFSAAFRKKFGVRPGEYLISGRQRLFGIKM